MLREDGLGFQRRTEPSWQRSADIEVRRKRSYEELRSACAEGRGEDAFRAAHTLKGVCSNLGFDRLYEASSALTEKLREEPHALTGTGELQAEVSRRYNETLAVLREFQG